jgi:hypothetical protein
VLGAGRSARRGQRATDPARAPQGFIVWHGEGESQLDDDTALELMASATPEGGRERMAAFWPAPAR